MWLMPDRRGLSSVWIPEGPDSFHSVQLLLEWDGVPAGLPWARRDPTPLSSGNSSARAEGVHSPVKTSWLPGHVSQSTPRYRLISLVLWAREESPWHCLSARVCAELLAREGSSFQYQRQQHRVPRPCSQAGTAACLPCRRGAGAFFPGLQVLLSSGPCGSQVEPLKRYLTIFIMR